MNEFISNGIGGIIMLTIIAAYLIYLALGRDVQEWHRWTFRAMCVVATASVMFHTVRVWYF